MIKVLLGFSAYPSDKDVLTCNNKWIARLKDSGYDVEGICLTINPPSYNLNWQQLEKSWKKGSYTVLSFYEKIAKKAETFDIFLNYNGINLHPEFVQQLPTYNIYSCFDDPESSETLSKPVAWAYDMCLIGNIAEVDTYKSWGINNVHFWPLGFRYDEFNPYMVPDQIISNNREIDISLFCEKNSLWRKERLEKYSSAFPQGKYFGNGWNNGYISDIERIKIMQNTKIGPNFHNSTGPINTRTFSLPANGIMQICDNKSHLAKLFELNSEVVGFDNINDAIELTRYYLSHDNERIEIAYKGWIRALRDYNEISCFNYLFKFLKDNLNKNRNTKRFKFLKQIVKNKFNLSD